MTVSSNARRELLKRAAELRVRLVAWDVIGIYALPNGAADDGEYDDLIWPIISWLREGADAPSLSAHLVGVLRAEYGLSIREEHAELEFAQSLVEWWRLWPAS